MDRGVWWAIVHQIKMSWKQLSNFHFSIYVKVIKLFFAFSCLICVVDRCFVLLFSSLDSFLPFLVLFVGVGTDLCGSSVSSCPRVQLGCHGAWAV